jgi:DNA-binding transcriptional regulator YiaG
MTQKELERQYLLSIVNLYPSDSAFALEFGIAQKTVSQWRTKKKEPSYPIVRMVQLTQKLKEMGIEVAELMT